MCIILFKYVMSLAFVGESLLWYVRLIIFWCAML